MVMTSRVAQYDSSFEGEKSGPVSVLQWSAGILALAMVALSSGPADAQDRYRGSGSDWTGPYGQLYVGASVDGETEFSAGGATLEVDRDVSTVGGGTLGYKFPFSSAMSLRTELDASYTKAKADNLSGADADLYGVLANGWIDLTNDSGITPYFGGGIGVGIINSETVNDSETGLGYQAGGGFLVDVPNANGAFVGVNYRYFGITQAEFQGVDVKTEGHRVTASLGVPF